MNALTVFRGVARDPNCIENQIATRQFAIRNITDTSWFSNIRGILNTYDLPSTYKSSLKYLSPEAVKVEKVHHIYSSVGNNTLDVRRAEVKLDYWQGSIPCSQIGQNLMSLKSA